jgi:O-antigen ligase
MLTIIIYIFGPALSAIAALSSACLVVYLLDKISKFKESIFPYYIYVSILANSTLTLLSSRDFIQTGENFTQEQGFLSEWLIRIASFFAIITTIDIVKRTLKNKNPLTAESKILLLSFVLYWLTNVGVTSIFAGHKFFNIPLIYGLFIGIGSILSTREASDDIVRITRNSIVTFTIIGIFLIIIKRDLVLDFTYGQGLIRGLPRFAGLAPHAITNAVLISIALFCIKLKPYENKIFNSFIFFICIAGLLLTQAKATIASFIISYIILNQCMKSQQIIDNFEKTNKSIKKLSFGLVLTLTLVIAIIFLGGKISSSIQSVDSAQLTTFTGRDVIWETALKEWRKYPIFGYGLQLFGTEHRQEIGMYFATAGHNQIIDTLGRAGLFGLSGLLFFVSTILYYSIRKIKTSTGLSLTIIIFSLMRFTTEVPFTPAIIGPETVLLILLLSSIKVTHKGNSA